MPPSPPPATATATAAPQPATAAALATPRRKQKLAKAIMVYLKNHFGQQQVDWDTLTTDLENVVEAALLDEDVEEHDDGDKKRSSGWYYPPSPLFELDLIPFISSASPYPHKQHNRRIVSRIE
jgi:hypothetical protein